MKITNKILLYFSSSIIVIATITFLIIYFSFAQYREEEFQQRQKEKIITTLQLITQVQKAESEIIESLNLVNINSLLEEKLLIFNKNKELIYSSLDDVPITYSKDLILHLNTKHPWIERKDGLYDVVAVYFTWNDNVFYGISKAYDTFGYTKLRFLSQVLITSFIALLIVIFIVSILLAKKISKPIIDLQQSISQYPLDEQYTPLPLSKTYWEVDRLTEVFNHLLQRVNEAMLFQKQTVHQISHELKTPIAILVSELEKTRSLLDDKKAKILLEQNINNAKYLAEIINILLAMSKIESGQSLPQKHIRVDEIIFNLIEDLNILYPHFHLPMKCCCSKLY
jgi:signal transduction histidine kinase